MCHQTDSSASSLKVITKLFLLSKVLKSFFHFGVFAKWSNAAATMKDGEPSNFLTLKAIYTINHNRNNLNSNFFSSRKRHRNRQGPLEAGKLPLQFGFKSARDSNFVAHFYKLLAFSNWKYQNIRPPV